MTVPTPQAEALRLALAALESCKPADTGTGHVIHPSFDEKAVSAAIEAVEHALTTHAGADGESVWLFKATDGKWMHFVSEKHRLDTMADDRWEVRQFFAAPPAPEALGVKRG